jgi:Coenzyme PQQ synthesis protein D (PqqD)
MRPIDDVEQLDFEGRSILIHRRRQALLVLNETASLIWQELCAGAGPADIARDLADSFQIPLARVEHDVHSILSTWQDAGLLREAPGPAAQRPAARDLPPRPVISRTYALCGRPIRFEFGDRALEALLHPLFAPAEVEDAGTRDRISLSASGGGYLVAANGGRPELRSDIEQALDAAIVRVLDLSYPDAHWLAIVHAGAVAGRGGALVLPGISGSGKSTLTAALVQAGLDYLSDDIAPLDGRTGRVLPVPFALSLKEGSWPVLKHAYPELSSLPVHTDDVRRWRYLDLAAARAPIGGETLRAIVFPRYQRGAETCLSEVDPLDALEVLVQARCWISLERTDVEALLALLETLPIYRLDYESLDAAVPICLELAAGGGPRS